VLILYEIFKSQPWRGSDRTYFYTLDTKQDLFLDERIFTKNSIGQNSALPLKTDYQLADDDNDGLTNVFEKQYLNSKTLFNKPDTDGNGILDSDEDTDADGLTNFEEQALKTNPLKQDTDNDKLSDYDEYAIQTDPLNPDSDNDGILDGDETFETKLSTQSGISMSMIGKGNIAGKCSITEKKPNHCISKMAGLVSDIFDLKSEIHFDNAELRIPLTSDIINGSHNIADLRLAHIDYQSSKIEIPENQQIIKRGNYLFASLNHFSHYAVINYPVFKESFSKEFHGSTRLKKVDNTEVRNDDGSIDLIITLDSSGSMQKNDPSFLRISAAENLIDQMEYTRDQIAVLDFDQTAKVIHQLSSDFESVKQSMIQIDASGKTNISDALIQSLEQLSDSRANVQAVILFSDGNSSVSERVLSLIPKADIQIYTIGLGTNINEDLLKKIAELSNGQYYKVDNAGDIQIPFDIISKASIDKDMDGLSDNAETNGILTWLGSVVYSDPHVRDSDGDGLSDGEEIFAVGINDNGEKVYKMISDPELVDSDNDGVSDYDELYPADGQEIGNPLIADY
jgi:Mg-chelatase subunit ChlD